MTRAAELSNIFKKIGDALYQAADELNALGADVAVNDSAAPVSPPRPVAATPSAAPVESDFAEGSEAMCPKHHDLYTEGQYGPYCRHQTDDPAWAKLKPDGKMFCKITPKNAAQYLRVRAAA